MKVTVISGTQGYIFEDVLYLKIEDKQAVHMTADGEGIMIIGEPDGEDEEDV